METPIDKIAAKPFPPVFQKTPHRLRPNLVTATSPRPPKPGSRSSQSRDTREDRGTREMKTTHNAQTLPHGR